ncbi:hypothetical protein J7L70_05915 [Candidatus Bathyarchaeota archaeon]|nr:hypothetical protein [Candidatus Bathyarchaeota archaeon]
MITLRELAKRYWDYIALVLIVVYATLSVKTFYRPGIPIGWDHPNYINQAWFTFEYLLPEGRLLGWSPLNQFGWPLNQFYYCGPHTFVAGLTYLFIGFMGFYTIYKLALNIVYASYAPAMYIYVRALTGDRVAAVAAALLSVTVFPGENPWLDAGLRQIYEIGMWGQSMGTVLSLVASGLAVYMVDLDLGFRWLVMGIWASFFSAATMVTHPMMFYAFVVSLAVLMAMRASTLNLRISIRRVLDFLFIACLTAAFTAFWLIPMLRYNGTYHNLTWKIKWDVGRWALEDILSSFQPYTWLVMLFSSSAIPSRLWTLTKITESMRLKTLGAAFLALGLTTFLLSLLTRISHTLLLAAFLLALGYLIHRDEGYHPLLSATVLLWIGAGPDSLRFKVGASEIDFTGVIPFYEQLAFGKCVALARYMIIALAGIGFSRIIQLLNAYSIKKPRAKPKAVMLCFLLSLTLVSVSLSSQVKTTDIAYPLNGRLIFALSEDYPLPAEVDELITWVLRAGKTNTYVLIQDTLGVVDPPSHYVYLTSMVTGTPVIGGIYGTRYITDPIANTEDRRILSVETEKLAGDLGFLEAAAKELGITYIAVIDPVLRNSLRRHGYRPLFRNSLYEVFRTRTFNPIVSIENPKATLRVLEYDVDRIVIEVRGTKYGDILKIRMLYYPDLDIRLNGRPVAAVEYYPSILEKKLGLRIPFIEIMLPGGNGVVTITYKPDMVSYTTSLATFTIALAATAVYLTRRLWKVIRLRLTRGAEKWV